MKRVTYFDVEYANPKSKAICQIGILCENYETKDPYYPELNIYVNPEDGFATQCVRVHGITANKVKDEPNFKQVWEKIEKYFTNTVVIGHNVAGSDLDALVKNLRRYDLDIPVIYYIDTLQLAKEYIDRYRIPNYSMSALCQYFDIDIDSEHNAFDDACACGDLFNVLVEEFDINPEIYVNKYEPKDIILSDAYIDSSILRKSISEFYGVIRGFSIDNKINTDEFDFIENWKMENEKYSKHKEIADIITVIDNILDDEVITFDEIMNLQMIIKTYLDKVSTSPITLATQILDGILKGIVVDEEFSEEECKNLRQWLYDNIYLSDHFPFNKTIEIVEQVLEDSILTKEESEYLTSVIDGMLDPVESLKSQIHSVEGKHICLSGNFAYGNGFKAPVEEYILERGGIIDNSVKKTTDYLIIGDWECQAYSNGNYGTKVKKAIEYNEKGCHIEIIKESDFFSNVK